MSLGPLSHREDRLLSFKIKIVYVNFDVKKWQNTDTTNEAKNVR